MPRTIIRKDMGKEHIEIFDDVAPNIWGIYDTTTINQSTGKGRLDLDKVNQIMNDERTDIAKQVFNLTISILKQQTYSKGYDVEKEWNQQYGDVTPEINSSHDKLIAYSTGALFYMDIITPFEYDITEPLADESGYILGMKRMPKPQDEDDIASQYMGDNTR